MTVGDCIESFLKNYRKYSHLDETYGGLYYWNERDVHWALLSFLKRNAPNRGIGSHWWVHAEGDIGRPRYVRSKEWRAKRRADIVVTDHQALKRAMRMKVEPPAYEAMIEVKLFWTGSGKAASRSAVESDFRKLQQSLSGGITKNAFLVVLDGLNVHRLPYFKKEDLRELKKGSGRMASTVIYHWPDLDQKVDDIEIAPFGKY